MKGLRFAQMKCLLSCEVLYNVCPGIPKEKQVQIYTYTMLHIYTMIRIEQADFANIRRERAATIKSKTVTQKVVKEKMAESKRLFMQISQLTFHFHACLWICATAKHSSFFICLVFIFSFAYFRLISILK